MPKVEFSKQAPQVRPFRPGRHGSTPGSFANPNSTRYGSTETTVPQPSQRQSASRWPRTSPPTALPGRRREPRSRSCWARHELSSDTRIGTTQEISPVSKVSLHMNDTSDVEAKHILGEADNRAR